jgi:hypothetical protein
MKRLKLISSAIRILVCLTVISAAEVASAVVIAFDSASDTAYSFVADGSWKGQYSPTDPHQVGQNTPGDDNGGFGFLPWNFDEGAHVPGVPYGNLNHFIDVNDFPTTVYNDLNAPGAPTFGLGNCNTGVGQCASGAATSKARRPFAQPLAVGDVISADIDTPAEFDRYTGQPTHYPFAFVSFEAANGLDAFGIGAGDVFPWRFGDKTRNDADYGEAAGVGSIDPLAPSDGSSFSLEITSATPGAETGRFTFDGVSLDIDFKWGLPVNIVFTSYMNNAEGTLGNPTGEHAFYFNNLKIERPPFGLAGDYNSDGTVDAADYVVWRKTDSANANGYTTWVEHFSETNDGSGGSAISGGGAIPEPSSLILALLFFEVGIAARSHPISARQR